MTDKLDPREELKGLIKETLEESKQSAEAEAKAAAKPKPKLNFSKSTKK
jgi:hypothetical protein